jgi:hypothetical protein
MDNLKYFWWFEKLFKTKKALEYFLDEYQSNLDERHDLLHYYRPKTGKKKNKVNWTDLADRVHSEYTRLRECDDHGYCVCVTCQKKLHWYDMQEWHYRTRGHYALRYDDRNTHAQCYTCNCVLNWNYRNYHISMLTIYGPEVEDRLWTSNDVADYDQWWYETHILERNRFNEKRKAELIV